MCLLLKNLLLQYDKQSEQLDVEEECASNFEHQIEDLSKQLRNSTFQVISNRVNSDMKILISFNLQYFLHKKIKIQSGIGFLSFSTLSPHTPCH